MRELKYLKLFEAFDSRVLSATLGYIKSKSRFLEIVKNVCSSMDFPLSKLSDEYFEYLPFKKALYKNDMIDDEPCTGLSTNLFPSHGIEGEKCDNGKIKRRWGRNIRKVVCPHCDGTGVEPKKSEIKLLKIWFNGEGEYVGLTSVDGDVLSTISSADRLSENMGDYTMGSQLSISEVGNLKTGDYIYFNTSGGGDKVIAYVVKEGTNIYAIQNRYNGSAPDRNRNWRDVARYSWHISSGDFTEINKLDIIKNVDDEIDPYSWNKDVRYNRYSGYNTVNRSVRGKIADAHFAIILDLGKLKKSNFDTRSKISDERRELKKGSVLDKNMSDNAIRKENIARYISILSDRMDISKDITNANKLVKRVLFNKIITLHMVYTRVHRELNSIIDDYYSLMSREDKEYYANRLSDYSKSLYSSSMRVFNNFNENFDKLKSIAPEDKIKSLDLYMELSETIYDKITGYNIETLEDFEVVIQKLYGIRNLMTSNRFNVADFVGYIGSVLRDFDYYKNRVNWSYYGSIKFNDDIERIIRIVKKM